jgi:hypothetical protein
MKAQLSAALLCIGLLCGCSMQEISDRTPVSAAALDTNGEGLLLTAQTITISGTDAAPETALQSVEADSLEQGIERCGQSLFWSTAETAILEETQADSRLAESIQSLTDAAAIRPSVRLCVARGCTGREILNDEDSADGLRTLLDDAVQEGRAVDLPLYQALNAMLTDGIDLALPALTVEQDRVRTDGTAVFHGETLCGYLDEEETAMLALLRGDTDHITLYDSEGSALVLSQAHASFAVSAGEAAISLRGKLLDSSEKRVQQAARLCRQAICDLVSRLQAWNSDALGLGRERQRTHPQSSLSDWESRYPDLSVSAVVTLDCTQGGNRR